MAVLQMQKVSICALKKDRKAILEKIQSMGLMEVSGFESEEEGFQMVNTQEERSAFEKNAALADTALDILQEYVPEKVSMFASLEGKNLIEKKEYLEITQRERKFWIWLHRLQDCISRLQSARPGCRSWKTR